MPRVFMHNTGVSTAPSETRYLELDLLRSLAVVLMVFFHVLVDLKFFYGWEVALSTGGWWLLARSIAITFQVLVGIGFVISYDRATKKGLRGARLYLKYLRRGAVILAAASLVTGATRFLIPDFYIRFGILHLIGASTLLLPLFVRLREWNLLTGLFVIGVGNIVFGTRVDTALLLPLGFVPHRFASLDYFPMLPWMGVILLGMGIGYFLYIRHIEWRRHVEFLSYYAGRNACATFPGRHALLIYLLHQPLTFAVLIPLLGMPRA